jgi:hypothetical protein
MVYYKRVMARPRKRGQAIRDVDTIHELYLPYGLQPTVGCYTKKCFLLLSFALKPQNLVLFKTMVLRPIQSNP